MSITRNDLLEALRQYGNAPARRPAGEGWFTLAELAKQDDTTSAAIRYRIAQAKRRGVKIETASGSVLDEEGHPKRATFYRLLRNGKGP